MLIDSALCVAVRPLATAAAILGLGLSGGCAALGSDNADPNAPRVIREPAEIQTGSNLPRRGEKRNTGVAEADKDAIGSAVRGVTRSSGRE